MPISQNTNITRRQFIQNTSLLATGLMLAPHLGAAEGPFPVVRVPESRRKFKSPAVEKAIDRIQSSIGNKELAWLFGNCFPNTLDTTVDFEVVNGQPDTYVITGDIDAMWLRDSSAQVFPYLPIMKEDPNLQQLVAGVIRRQTKCIIKDPYANAFYKDENKISEWSHDSTDMKPGIHERKFEVDSLCYPIRLAYYYWKATGDTAPLADPWPEAVNKIVQTFTEQQRKHGHGPYHFARRTEVPTDTLAGAGYGLPVNPVGMICSMFRPSDDATIFPFLIPSNFFAVTSLRQAAEMLEATHREPGTVARCRALATEVEHALGRYAVVNHGNSGRIYAYEVDGFGNNYCIDDGNIPSLLSLPYLGGVKRNDSVYKNTRRYVLSPADPYYCVGRAAEGPGGPHAGINKIWPLGVITRALTATDDAEIKACLVTLQKTHAGTGFMHESFDKDDPTKFTRAWFAWANTIFGELILKTFHERPHLLD